MPILRWHPSNTRLVQVEKLMPRIQKLNWWRCGLWNVSINLLSNWIHPCSRVEMTRWKLCVSHRCVSSSGLVVLWDWIHFAEVSSTTRMRRYTITDSLTNRINDLGLRDFEFLSQRTKDRQTVWNSHHPGWICHMWSVIAFCYQSSYKENVLL